MPNSEISCVNDPTVLLMMHILRYVPPARHHSLVCSAGSQGYHALKEMLLSGVPGNTLLIESGDLREITDPAEGSIGGDVREDMMIGVQNGSSVPNTNTTIMNTPPHCSILYRVSRSYAYEQSPDYISSIPQHTPHVTVYCNATRLPNALLAGCTGLITIDLRPLSNVVTGTGFSFLEGCTGLRTIDLSPLWRVTQLEESFLLNCTELSSVDLTPLTEIGGSVQGGLLAGCSALTPTLDLSPLSYVSDIQSCFLQGCSSLKSLDLSPLSNLSVITSYFLGECSGLTSIDLGPLSQVTQVQGDFLWGCVGLTCIDLSPLSRLREIGSSFLEECSGLKTIDLRGLTKVTTIQPNFMKGCSSLTAIDFSPLCNVVDIQRGFLQGCTALTVIDLTPMTSLRVVPKYTAVLPPSQ